MIHRAGLVLAVLPLLLAGCGSTSPSSGGGATRVMRDHTAMGGSGMSEMSHSGSLAAGRGNHASPSATASMICGEEIRLAVGRSLDLPTAPQGARSWHHRVFGCTYHLAPGDLRLSVKDLTSPQPGRAYFDHLRARLAGASAIRGLANFGLPAFETPRGDVVFVKDHKTLWVDASRLEPSALPAATTRQDVAYAVAAAVVGCWTE